MAEDIIHEQTIIYYAGGMHNIEQKDRKTDGRRLAMRKKNIRWQGNRTLYRR